MKKQERLITAVAVGAGVGAIAYSLLSANTPSGTKAVKPFYMQRYLGKWYEIARMPSWIEKNLNQVTEEYTDNGDGSFKVVTKVFNAVKKEWKELTGKIKFSGAENEGTLKVSYLGPLYLAYNVLDIDEDYQHALVSGSSTNYLWILSRSTFVPHHVLIRFLKKAAAWGFDISKMEWPAVA